MTILHAVMQKFSRKAKPELAFIEKGLEAISLRSKGQSAGLDSAPAANHELGQQNPSTLASVPPNTLNLAELSQRYAPLIRLQAKRQLLEVSTLDLSRGRQTLYQSIILDINLQGRYLLLDDLFPNVGEDAIALGDILTIRHHRQGRLLSFSSRVIHISYSHGAPCYAVELPEEVGYRQRRLFPRMALGNQTPLTVRLKSPWKTPWFATAHNLSAGGMRLSVGGNILEQLNRGSIMPACEFSLGNDLTVSCQARIKGFKFIGRPYRHTQISVEFIDLNPQRRLQVQQYINALVDDPVAAA
jgi:c-di-GMP-binding flagellar brake protein YcgR